LFREEVRANALSLSDGLEAIGREGLDPDRLEPLVRAAQSIRGAARIVGLDAAADLAGAMEAALSAAQQGRGGVGGGGGEALGGGTAVLAGLIELSPDDAPGWAGRHEAEISALLGELEALPGPVAPPHPRPHSPEGRGEKERPSPEGRGEMVAPARLPVGPVEPEVRTLPVPRLPAPQADGPAREPAEAVVRVTAQSLNRLMSLAG